MLSQIFSSGTPERQ